MNLARYVEDTWNRMFGENVFRATVTGTSGNQVTITSQRLNGTFPRLVSYASPTANDEVVVAKLGSGWIVLGEITR